jgi:regulatory protein
MSTIYKKMSYDRALQKAMWYCSFQERCQQDLEKRFLAWGLEKSNWDKLIDVLIDDNYLNEQRYIEAFVRGKFRIKKWGRNKITVGLMAKRVYNENLVVKAFDSEIDNEDYLNVLQGLIVQKSNLLDEVDVLIKRDKLYRYLLNKGYESELVSKELTSYLKIEQ